MLRRRTARAASSHAFLLLAAMVWLVAPSPALAAAKGRAARAEADPATPGTDVPPGKVYTYKQSGGAPRQLEIYFPPGWGPVTTPGPGVILFHGGGWSGGSLTQFRHACRYLASRGFVAATANYRMLSRAERESLPPGESYKRVCVIDAKSAIRWMKQHAGELRIDPARLITGGGSAGGHVSVLATLNAGLDDPADPPGFDTRVAGYLLFNPAFRATDREDPAIDVLAHLGRGLAPAVIFFGTEDAAWKPGTDALLAQLRARGDSRAELWLAAGQAHGFFNRPPWQDVTLAEADRFLGRLGLLRGEPALPRAAGGETLTRAP